MANAASSAAAYERFQPTERLVLLLEAMARGDQAEVERVRRTCPRRTYSQIDAAFQDRYELALDLTVIACGDLRAIVSQMRLLADVRRLLRHTGTAHQVTATMAFLDGVRLGRGMPPIAFFRPERHRPSGPAAALGPAGNADEVPEDLNEGDEQVEQDMFAGLGEAFHERMHAVEHRAERWSRRLIRRVRQAELALASQMKGIWSAYDAFCRSRLGMAGERLLEAFDYPARQAIARMLRRHQDVAVDEAAAVAYRERMCSFWDRRFEDEQ